MRGFRDGVKRARWFVVVVILSVFYSGVEGWNYAAVWADHVQAEKKLQETIQKAKQAGLDF